MATLDLFIDEIDRLSRRLIRNLECCDRTFVACCGVTVAQASSLFTLIEQGPATMNELATEMRLHGTTMTRMVDSLVAKGLAVRSRDTEDRRIVHVGLTTRGREAVEQMQQFKREFFAAAFAEMPEGDRETILKALRRLSSTAEELGARCCAF